jgi:hypothetical protein
MADDDIPVAAPATPESPAAGNVTSGDEIYRSTATEGDTDDVGEPTGDEDLLEGETETGAADDDLEDYEDDGKRYKVSKALKPKLMMHADYTRKTQEIAETRRALEARQAEIFQQAQTTNLHAENIGKLHQANEQLKSIDGRLTHYDQLNWQQIEDENPGYAQKLLREATQLRGLRERWVNHHTEVVNAIRTAEYQRQTMAQRDFAQRVEAARATVTRAIPDWSEEKARTLRTYAQREGVPETTIMKFQDDPYAVIMLNKAHRYDQLMAKRKAVGRTPTPSTPEPRATTQVGRRSSTSASALSDRQSPEAWVEARERQLRARRGH